MTEERVIIAGAGPVGLVAAAHLVRHGVPVTVLEAGLELSAESRASTFHPATLDLLDAIDAAADLIAEGLKAPRLQYRSKRDGVIAEFDFGAIADATRHPYRLQAEQCKLTRILYRRLREDPRFRIEYRARVQGVEQLLSKRWVRQCAGLHGSLRWRRRQQARLPTPRHTPLREVRPSHPMITSRVPVSLTGNTACTSRGRIERT